MRKPPVPKTTQKDYRKTAIRLPAELHADIQEAAERHGRSMNAEILARLQSSPIDDVLVELDELKVMIRKVLDQV